MSKTHESEKPPETWRHFRQRTRHHWARYFLSIDWLFGKMAWVLSQMSLLKVLAYAETFSVLVALIFWVAETGERRQQKHFQAWQVINTAQGNGGSGGRLDALQELNEDHVALVGVDVSQAYLQGVRLEKAELRRGVFHDADLRNAHFRKAGLQDSDFKSANLRDADLREADLSGADFTDVDMVGATLAGAKVEGVTFDRVDFENVDLASISDYHAIKSINQANIHGVKNPPAGFVAWAMQHGAINGASLKTPNPATAPANK